MRQPTLPIDFTPRSSYEPISWLAEGAKRYNATKGRNYEVPAADVQVDPDLAFRRAKQYGAAPEHDASAIPGYEALGREVDDQFDFLTRGEAEGGLGMSVEFTQHDPYPSPQHMFDDVNENRRLQVWDTPEEGTHPVFGREGNNRFRAVHDAFGHLAIGRGFSRHGEEGAYQSHSQMFSEDAGPALETETRGQNSFLNYGPNPGTFGPQKLAQVADVELPKSAMLPWHEKRLSQQQFAL